MSERLSVTGRYHKRDCAGVRSVMEIDDRITAPSFGFRDAANYYRTQSALPYLEGIRVPMLLIHAKDTRHGTRRSPGLHRPPVEPLLAG